MQIYEWKNEAPKEDGDFFYTGPLPGQKEDVVLIAQVFTEPKSGNRMAVAFIPPGWRGDKKRQAIMHCGTLDKWKGQWAGPEFGLCCVSKA